MLWTGCRVVGMLCDDPPTVEYIDEHQRKRQLRSQWLIGADGKVGIVRKHFLEPTAGIKQNPGKYPYNGTWIAANLKITPPTPETHPEFPLWDLGYSPEEVYDLFWPKGWHFCSPPGKPTAAGRFGPHEDRTWRHELRQEDWDDSMDAESLFWEHLKPMITRIRDTARRCEFPASVPFPSDCIEILRCRPFRFTHKVVSRWFHKRTILIGDAAHVFPPFAGQGIASGVRDAHQLAWRLALLLRAEHPVEEHTNSILESWSLERRRSVDDAAMFSMLNGHLCNNAPSFWLRALVRLPMFLEQIGYLPRLLDPQAMVEHRGFSNTKGGFFLATHNGGARLAQIHVQSYRGKAVLSDSLLRSCDSIFTILAVCRGGDDDQIYRDARAVVSRSGINPAILSDSSIVAFSPRSSTATLQPARADGGERVEIFSPVIHPRLQQTQHDRSYMERLGQSTRFAVVRPDLFVYACCKNTHELSGCLSILKKQLGP